MSTQVKWGVIGSGGIARRRTLPEGVVAADNASLVSVFDVNPRVNVEVAKESNSQAVNSIEELLATDIDALPISTSGSIENGSRRQIMNRLALEKR